MAYAYTLSNKGYKMRVSVIMITFNHEPYIREAINGVLMQKVNFELELIIADDCSTDNTAGIINDVLDNHANSSIIRYTRHQTNKGMMPNFIWALQQCKGEYIALCEGDDYWTDPYKLQKQVDFLEDNKDYAGVCTNLYLHNRKTDQRIIHNRIPNTIKYIDTNLQLQENYINTCTFLSKKEVLNFLLKHPTETTYDTTFFTYTTFLGKIGYLPEPMANYNQFVGVHHRQKKSALVELNLKILTDIEQHAPLKITHRLFTKLSKRKLYFRAAIAYAQENNLTKAFRYYVNYLTLLPIGLAFAFSSKNVSKITLKMKYSLLLNMLSSIKRKVFAGK